MSDIVKLGCCDGVVIEVEKKVVMCMESLKPRLESNTGEICIPLQKVECHVLEKAVYWIQFHQGPEVFLATKKLERLTLLETNIDELDNDKDAENSDVVEDEFVHCEEDWRREFFHVDHTTMFDIIFAANELGIPGLLAKAMAFSALYELPMD